MNRFSCWLPTRRQLKQHLARLVDTLEDLLERLRERIARSIGEVVTNLVHELTRHLTVPGRSSSPGWGRREPPPWDEPHYQDWGEDRGYEEDRHSDEGSDSAGPKETTASRCAGPCLWASRQRGGG